MWRDPTRQGSLRHVPSARRHRHHRGDRPGLIRRLFTADHPLRYLPARDDLHLAPQHG